MYSVLLRLIKPLAMVIVLAVMLTACSDQNLTPEEAVRLRAQGWADALIRGDLDGAYQYTSPSYRQFSSSGRYHARVGGTGQWDVAEAGSVACMEQACDVEIMIEYEIKHMGTKIRRPVSYKWIEVGGEWWLYVPAK